MKKSYSNPEIKVIILSSEALLQSSNPPDKLYFNSSEAYEEEEGVAE